MSAGKPTHWPTNVIKKTDVLDFTIIKGLNVNELNIMSSLDLSSDYIPLIVEYTNKPVCYNYPIALCNKKNKLGKIQRASKKYCQLQYST